MTTASANRNPSGVSPVADSESSAGRVGGSGRARAGGSSGSGNPIGWPVGVTLTWFGVMLMAIFVLMLTQPVTENTWLIVWAVVAAALPPSILLAYRVQASGRSERELARLATAIDTMVSEAGLSESAKRVLHRKEERELLRRAIEQDILARDFDAALVLVNELADRFGYRSDAESFRTRIERAKSQTTEEQVSEAIHAFHQLLKEHRWEDAYAEAGRVQRLFGDHHRTRNMRERVDDARTAYRAQLERRFLETAEAQDADAALEILKELDHYLTPAEAEPFAEVARGVISKSRENLGSRFKLLVQDHEWNAAMGVGQQIIEEFPNTRMAAEVRELMPKLRERAAVVSPMG